ncbi:caspase family protein [Dinoroseobacter sp. S76]|uniref:caspase family protein n=1 Tax=Dinoroseobacter sp. S76 TaxID=3415124 RepID=UPI003C7AE07B
MATAALLAPKPVAAEIYALVIGIDRYSHITPLRGAVNDAIDISSAIAALEPEALRVLTNETATRDEVLSVWQSYLDRAQDGDTIIVTFAGHGASEPAAYPETEEDGRDETFLLAGFSPVGAQSAERIRDDEIAALIASRPGVEHIIVADSCHSGTAIRATTLNLGYRFFTHDGIEGDPLPPPPPPPAESAEAGEMSLDNNVFFAAVGDAELAPEINIDGNVRGALSFAFANGLRGQADRNDDGLVTKGELETHIRREVKFLLKGKQKPRVSPVGLIDKPLFDLRSSLSTSEPAFTGGFSDLDPVPVYIRSAEAAPFQASVLSGATTASEPQLGGLVVDFEKGQILDGTGDLVRALTREVGYDWRLQTQAVVDKMRVINALSDAVIDSKINVSFSYGDELYYEYDVFGVLVTGRSTSHVTVLNLAADGSIQWIYPRYAPIDTKTGLKDPAEIAPTAPLQFDAEVWAPFGAEHILVIETEEPHDAVRRAANRFDDTANMSLFWRELTIALDGIPHAVAVHSFYTLEE